MEVSEPIVMTWNGVVVVSGQDGKKIAEADDYLIW
jgi:hypothetical protein